MSTRVIDTDAREDDEREEERWVNSESGEDRDAANDDFGVHRDDGWDDDGADEVIPPRPRGRLLRPLPLDADRPDHRRGRLPRRDRGAEGQRKRLDAGGPARRRRPAKLRRGESTGEGAEAG